MTNQCDLSVIERDVRIARLLASGLLPQIVSDELGVPMKTITEIRKKIKLPPRPGQRPTSQTLLEKPRALLSGSILIRQYQRATAGEARESIDLDALLGIYTALSRTYLARAGVILRHTSLTHAWVLLRDFNAGRVIMIDCQNRHCHVQYPVVPDAYPVPDCPFCRLSLFPNRTAQSARRARRRPTRKAGSAAPSNDGSFSDENQS